MTLYPSSFKKHYAQEMELLLEDQLRDAERGEDPALLREVYWSAVSELPLSILRERLSTPLNLQSILERLGVSEWRAFSYSYFLLIGLFLIGGIGDVLWLTVFPLLLMVIMLWYTVWKYTGRRSLAFFVLLVGIVAGLLSISLSSALLANSRILVTYFELNVLGGILAFAPLVLVPYLVAGWYRLHPKQYARQVIMALSDEELQKLREKNAYKRRRVLQFFGVVVALIVIPNLIAYFTDPVKDISVDISDRVVPRNQNGYYVIESAEIPHAVYSGNDPYNPVSPVGGYVAAKNWDAADVARILALTTDERQRYTAAAALPYYQDPMYESKENVRAVGVHVADTQSYLLLSKVQLLEGSAAARTGDMSTAINRVHDVLTLARHMEESNGLSFTMAEGLSLQQQAEGFIDWLQTTTPLSAAQKQAIVADLPSQAEMTKNMQRAMRWDELADLVLLPTYGNPATNGWAEENPFLFLPFAYQPNRTAGLVAERSDQIINAVPTSCSSSAPSNPNLDFPGINQVFTFNGFGKWLANGIPYVNGDDTGFCEVSKNSERLAAELQQS